MKDLDRKQKTEFIADILTGKRTVTELRKKVVFLELSTKPEELGIYYDSSGNRYDEAGRKKLIEQKSKEASLLWEEIKTY